MKAVEHDVVYVRWLDSVGRSRWTNKDVPLKLAAIHSIGMLSEETDEGVRIRQSLSEDDSDHELLVPWACIEKYEILSKDPRSS